MTKNSPRSIFLSFSRKALKTTFFKAFRRLMAVLNTTYLLSTSFYFKKLDFMIQNDLHLHWIVLRGEPRIFGFAAYAVKPKPF